MVAEKRERIFLYYGWLGLLVIGILWGLFASIKIIAEGHFITGATELVPWGFGVSLYVFWVLTSTGLTFVSSFFMVFGVGTYGPLVKRCIFLAIFTLLVGFLSIAIELGQPFRSINFVLYPNFSSAMWWMSFFYFLYLVALALKFWQIQVGKWESVLSKVSGIAALLFAIAAHSTLGGIFGLIFTRPGFYGAFQPVYFLLTALFSGFAITILFSFVSQALYKERLTRQFLSVMDQVSKHFAWVIGLVILFFVWKMLVGLYPDAGARGFGGFSYALTSAWWQVEVWLGLVAPLVLLGIPALRRTTWAKVLASILALIGIFAGRLELVLIGQHAPVFPWLAKIAEYTPTSWEWSILILSGCLLLFFYSLGERFLFLKAAPPSVGAK